MLTKNRIIFWFLCLASLCLLFLHARSYMPFLADDALISLRYAKRFLAGQGLTWTDGPRVEGYSNLLWILVISGLNLLTIDLISSARILGFVFSSGTCVLLAWHYLKDSSFSKVRAAIVGIALLFFVSTGSIAVWTIGGLEQPLFCFLLVLGTFALFDSLDSSSSRKNLSILGLSLGGMCLTRPEGPLFVAITILTLLVSKLRDRNRISIRQAAFVLIIPLLFIAAQLIFRLAFYGSWVPNTALVKIAPSWHHLGNGLDYVLRGFGNVKALSISGTLAACLLAFSKEGQKRKRAREKGIFLLSGIVLWSAYLVSVGGDIFPAFRQVLPVYTLQIIALCEGLLFCAEKPFLKSKPSLLFVLLAIALTWHVLGQRDSRELNAAEKERWEWDGEVIGRMLKQAFGSANPLVAVTASGCIPYWSDLPALDMLGLNDHYLPRHPPSDFGQGPLAHELGDGNYFMSRKPDLIIFHVGLPKLLFRAGLELANNEVFLRHYQFISFTGVQPYEFKSFMWIRRESEKIGIRLNGNSELVLPAYFFFEEAPGDISFRLNQRNTFEAMIPPQKEWKTFIPKNLARPVPTEPGSWFQLTTEDQGAFVLIKVRNVSNEAQPFVGFGL